MPFVTLDPLMRAMEIENGQPVLVSDTFGFISKLPSALVAAFRATLEELEDADLLLHVVDVSDLRMEVEPFFAVASVTIPAGKTATGDVFEWKKA